jgi:hypothetical protein
VFLLATNANSDVRRNEKIMKTHAAIHLLDAGHFALDEKTDKIARLILDFMSKQLG